MLSILAMNEDAKNADGLLIIHDTAAKAENFLELHVVEVKVKIELSMKRKLKPYCTSLRKTKAKALFLRSFPLRKKFKLF